MANTATPVKPTQSERAEYFTSIAIAAIRLAQRDRSFVTLDQVMPYHFDHDEHPGSDEMELAVQWLQGLQSDLSDGAIWTDECPHITGSTDR